MTIMAIQAQLFRKSALRRVVVPFTCACAKISFSAKHQQLQSDNPEPAFDGSGYDLAYKLPYIQIAAAVNKLKLYQTVVSGIAIPSSFALQTAGIIPLEVAVPVAAISVSLMAALYAAGVVCAGQVGRVWVSHDGASVRLAHVGFWGDRVESTCAAADLVPLSELPAGAGAPYVRLRRYSAPARLKLSLRFGQVTDAVAFRQAFGNAPFD